MCSMSDFELFWKKVELRRRELEVGEAVLLEKQRDILSGNC